MYQSSSGRQRRSGPEVTVARKSVVFAPDRPTKNNASSNNIHFSQASGNFSLDQPPISIQIVLVTPKPAVALLELVGQGRLHGHKGGVSSQQIGLGRGRTHAPYRTRRGRRG